MGLWGGGGNYRLTSASDIAKKVRIKDLMSRKNWQMGYVSGEH